MQIHWRQNWPALFVPTYVIIKESIVNFTGGVGSERTTLDCALAQITIGILIGMVWCTRFCMLYIASTYNANSVTGKEVLDVTLSQVIRLG